MPYADDKKTGKTGKERKREQMKGWRKKSIESGYGKWLYGRRKLRFDDAERFREVLERIVEVAEHGRMTDEDRLSDVAFRARNALAESATAEAELGSFH